MFDLVKMALRLGSNVNSLFDDQGQPAAFEFISIAAQIGDVRIFMRKLPDVLSR
jgi:hypothetical protein